MIKFKGIYLGLHGNMLEIRPTPNYRIDENSTTQAARRIHKLLEEAAKKGATLEITIQEVRP